MDLFAFIYTQTSSQTRIIFEDTVWVYLFIFCIISGFFIKYQMFMDIQVNLWVFNSISQINAPVFMVIQCDFHYYKIVIQEEIRMVIPQAFLLLFGIVLFILVLFILFFHMKMSIFLFKVCKVLCWYLADGIKCVICFCLHGYFCYMNLPNYKQGRYFCLLKFSSIFSSSTRSFYSIYLYLIGQN